ncbi:MAG: M14 family metallopeptidase [Dethiobacteria bacterium]
MTTKKEYFADSYEENRAKFRDLLRPVKDLWPSAEIEQYPVISEEDLTIDLIRALPSNEQKRLIIISTGLHGIEGYIGAAAQHLFVEEYLKVLSPGDTGLLLVHSINPWGMKNRRRVNENNVDLNRNFIFEETLPGEMVNPAYDKAMNLLNPQKPLSLNNNPLICPAIFNKILTMGPAVFREAVLYGQYRHPKGLYYGGKGYERSTELFDRIVTNVISDYEKILHIDMHSGYGPRNQMTLVNSIHEKRDSSSLQKLFSYPLVAKTDHDEFYQMQGDMIDYLYQLINRRYPEKNYYGTSFEFGTYGESFTAVIRSLKALINENRLFHYGSTNNRAARKAREDFEALFNPKEEQWRDKAMQDSRQAFTGILRGEGFSDSIKDFKG